MEANVRQYQIPPQGFKMPWPKKLVWFFLIAAYAFAFRWIVEALFHWKHKPFLEALIFPVVFAAIWVFLPRLRWFPRQSSLIMGENFVEGRTKARWFTFTKRIYRDRIKSISENKWGMCVMDRGQFAARMLGFVFVPATMPEYQEIRLILSGWAPVQGRR
jgi:hypothetical protein